MLIADRHQSLTSSGDQHRPGVRQSLSHSNTNLVHGNGSDYI